MLKRYFQIAWRYISKHKVYSFINIVGLALGLCVFIVLVLTSHYELSFDNFHPDKERIYRIVGDLKTASGEDIDVNNAPYSLQLSIQQEIPGLDEVAGFYPYKANISVKNASGLLTKFDGAAEDGNWWTSVIAANQSYFAIFKYDWLAGNEATALTQPFTAVISERRAHQYFGTIPLEKMLGREIIYNDSVRVHVSGIVKEWNENTDFPFTDIVSITSLYQSGDWKNVDVWTFVKLSTGTSSAKINLQLERIIRNHPFGDPLLKRSMYLQPLADIHFNAHFYEDGFRKAHLPTIYSLIAIACFILLIAIINFVNLSTAQTIRRAKEMGVRKILGGNKANIIFQFLTETFIQTVVAMCIALVSIKPVMTAFHHFIPHDLRFNLAQPSTIFAFFLLILVATVLSGLYPAKILSSYDPISSLKGFGSTSTGNKLTVKKSLMVFQLSLSLFFIIAVIIIGGQLQFIRNKDLGYNTNAIIIIKTSASESLSKVNVLAEKIKQLPAVQMLGLEAFPPIGPAGNLLDIRYKGKKDQSLLIGMDEGNENFIPTYQMKLLAGRNLSHGDSLNELVINESLSKLLGFVHPGDAISQFVHTGNKMIPIVGVVSDYHTKTLQEAITPVCIGNIAEDQREIVLRLSNEGIQFDEIRRTLASINVLWNEVYPGNPFNYSFLDESIAHMYEKERTTSTLMRLAMFITVFISCLGLFGLILFSVERRTKEIGIRKVLGATVLSLVFLLSKDFFRLIFISMLIASPVAYYFMHSWLQNYTYRIQISWWMFASAWLAAILVAMLTMSFQAIKAGLANPVKSRRTE